MTTPTKFSLVTVKRRSKAPEDMPKAIGNLLERLLPDESWYCPLADGSAFVILFGGRAFVVEALKDRRSRIAETHARTHIRILWAGASVLAAGSVKAVEHWLRDKGVPLKGEARA